MNNQSGFIARDLRNIDDTLVSSNPAGHSTKLNNKKSKSQKKAHKRENAIDDGVLSESGKCYLFMSCVFNLSLFCS